MKWRCLISVYDDRIEFVSVGGLPDGIALDDIMLGLSVCRNPKLAAIFYRLKLIEAYGTGMPKILKAYDGNERKPEKIIDYTQKKCSSPLDFSGDGELARICSLIHFRHSE